MALTTMMSGMFWGMTRAVVQTTMHFQYLGWHGWYLQHRLMACDDVILLILFTSFHQKVLSCVLIC